MPPARRERIVERRGDDQFDDRTARPAERARVEIGALHVSQARGDDNARGVVLGRGAPGQHGEIRQFGKRDVHAKRARTATPSLYAPPKSLGQGPGIDEVEVKELGVNPRGDGSAADGFALVGLDADSAFVLDDNLANARRKPDVDAVGDDGLGDGAHAADGMPQAPPLPFTSPKLWCRRT